MNKGLIMAKFTNLEQYSVSELTEMISEIQNAINRKTSNFTNYAHDCQNSSRYHLAKYKHWAKLISCVDTTKSNGYAFQGEFLDVKSINRVPANSIVVEVCGTKITAYLIKNGAKEKLSEGKTTSMIDVIQAVADKILN